MKVTGSQLRKALVKYALRRDQAVKTFEENIYAFKDEHHPDLKLVSKYLYDTMAAIAFIQTAQQEFNSKVFVQIGGQAVSLAVAIKMKAGIGRLKGLWDSAYGNPSDQFMGLRRARGISPKRREKDQEEQVRTVSTEAISEEVERLSMLMTEVQDAIASGNSQSAEVAIDADLLDG